ncbi:hypothetical protein [Enterovibrio norvegicus]|uniref:Uncharacterized protein n=1 Tax=Enterovibrio norvegicus DSM 15893 TaxID=1121869 RepID=A0A1I5NMM8_9GAMM|nr:hypothetical protein [Enterovibrio norvegicus]SFP22491.1 hypothetical protein SAMN03084138_01636 [Enterovibrio norvegicus DSM 15893]
MLRDIQKFVRLDKTNYLESYAGNNERLDKELNTTFKIFFYLSDSVENIWNKSTHIDHEKSPWLVDSVIQLSRGMELLNSCLSLLVNNHIPANSYLFRSSINCFWFSYKFMIGGVNGFAWNHYIDEKKKLSTREIKDHEMKKIISQDDESTKIINLFNGILHTEYEQGYRFHKSSRGREFELSPHNFETDELIELFEDSILNIRGIMEFSRCVIQSTFIDREPDRLLKGEYFNSRNLEILHTKDYRKLAELTERLEVIDLKKYS